MADDIARHDGGMARQDAVAKLDQRRDLRSGIVMAIAVQVDDLDADRGGVQGLATAPVRAAGVPGNAILGHQPIERAVFGQHIMRADAMLARAVAQDVEQFLQRQFGVVQHQHVDDGVRRTRRMIGRRKVNDVHDKAETSPRSRRSRS